LQSVGLTSKTTPSATSSLSSSSAAGQSDNSQLSPFAQLMNTLQQLQQSDPSKYPQVTQQIATNLQSAAQSATSRGNTAAANQLNQLASDFSNASSSGQLPNVADLAKALGGGNHHQHNAPTGDSTANQALSQLLSAFQTNSVQSASTDPMAIITNTLSSAGVTREK
jgi:hypothetical protein